MVREHAYQESEILLSPGCQPQPCGEKAVFGSLTLSSAPDKPENPLPPLALDSLPSPTHFSQPPSSLIAPLQSPWSKEVPVPLTCPPFGILLPPPQGPHLWLYCQFNFIIWSQSCFFLVSLFCVHVGPTPNTHSLKSCLCVSLVPQLGVRLSTYPSHTPVSLFQPPLRSLLVQGQHWLF